MHKSDIVDIGVFCMTALAFGVILFGLYFVGVAIGAA